MQMSVDDARQPLPPLVSVAAALCAVTEHLTREFASPQPAAPDWSEFEGRTALAVLAMHGISGLLAGKLLWRGLDGWAKFLSLQRDHIARRIVPSAEVRADRKFALTSDPTLAPGDWGGLSRGRRILRALSARTPRPRPLNNVRAVLAGPRSGSGAGSML
jgi:hypothetical protein